MMQSIAVVADEVLARRSSRPAGSAFLVGVSGIDGCGKGHVTGELVAALAARGLKTAAINVDGWLNLPPVRFDPARPGEHFYENALRLDEMFARLVLPLRQTRGVRVTVDRVEETATATVPYTYDFDDLDVVVLEGIFLFKRAHREHFDLAVWIDCSWDTALERAVARSQEGLPPEETVRAYRTIYFPAEETHIARDDPRGAADFVVPNDPRLAERGAAGGKKGLA